MTRRVDLRSDTVTQPTQAMRDAMAVALVGDDGYGEDPSVVELETYVARLLDKEAAIFVPSGVMGNQMALRVLARPGDLVIAGRGQHLVSFEMGAAARNSSIQLVGIDDGVGVLALRDVLEVIDSEMDHQPHVAAVAIENTHMPSGGTPWPLEAVRDLAEAIGDRPLHLDGARLMNAVVATGVSAADYAAPATTVLIALTKGLCAPVGSLLAGPSDLMERARVERKRLGGAMRQAGFLAAAGLVAITTMVDRLADDHRRARRLAEAVAAAFPSAHYDPASCQTNIVVFEHPEARDVVARLASRGVEGGTVAPTRVRLVTHAGVDDGDIDYACDAVTSLGH